MGVEDDQSYRPKKRSTITDVMMATCGPLYEEIRKSFGFEIINSDIIAFAKEQECADQVVILAEHIAHILVHAYRERCFDIAGLSIATRIKLQRIIMEQDTTDFDDSLLVEPEVDPKMHRLALDFLNR